MSEWERISTKEDFPKVKVYRKKGVSDTVLKLFFINKEFMTRQASWFWAPAWIAFVGLVGMKFEDYFYWIKSLGIAWWWAHVTAGFVVVVWLWAIFKPTPRIREIELDFGKDEIRVIQSARTVLKRKLSLLNNLTVQQHSEAFSKQLERQAQGRHKLSDEERTHCLVGWFGIGGAEPVVLVYRGEWPDNKSLYEVQQALNWALEQGKKAPSVQGTGKKGPSIKPPLD